jgi:release factor glutamine methyltransferase
MYDERVLAPRMWTLLQSDWAADLCPHLPDGPILELFAGAGQIGLAAAVRARRRLVQVEADAPAAEFARRNAEAIGYAEHEVRAASIDNAVHPHEQFPLILADPPYVRTGDLDDFPDDPPAAIDGGEDGLDLIRASLDVVRAHLAPGGACLLQVRGEAQAREVASLGRDASPELRVVMTQSVDNDRAIVHLVHADL